MSPTELRRRLARARSDETGQALIEYAFLTVLISIVAIVFLTAIGLDLTEQFDAVENAIGLGDPNDPDPAPVGADDAGALSGVH